MLCFKRETGLHGKKISYFEQQKVKFICVILWQNSNLCRAIQEVFIHYIWILKTFVRLIIEVTTRDQVSLSVPILKGHCQEDFAVLGQFCAKIITSRL